MDYATIVDIETQKSVLHLTDADNTCIFNPKGTMAFIPPCGSKPTKKGKFIALDNDLTIQQFLLKQAIIRYHLKKDVVKNATATHKTYATLTDEQKKYFDTYVFI